MIGAIMMLRPLTWTVPRGNPERRTPQRKWVNPDCGLKTRGWPEVQAALPNMVAVAQELRRTIR